jgi:hypothetical protein
MEASIPVALKQRSYKGWDAWFLQRGPLELALVPQVGGRIMGMIWQGHDLLHLPTPPGLICRRHIILRKKQFETGSALLIQPAQPKLIRQSTEG